MKEYDVVIIGSGAAGLTAAIYTARANLQPVVIDGTLPGGQLTTTTEVENYPGFPSGIMGPELMENFRKQAERFGTEYVFDTVEKILPQNHGYKIQLSSHETIVSKTIIISTGASPRLLGLPEEKKLMGRGVSTCATCDGAFFKNVDLIVAGGGDSAIEEATFLTKFAKKVYVVHRRDTLRASKIMQDRAFKNSKIEFIWDSAISQIHDVEKNTVTGATLKNLKTGKTTELKVDGIFVAIGHIPNSAPFQGLIECDEQGYIKVFKGTQTNQPGIFAAGDCVDHVYRQAITAAGMGCQAALDAERYLANLE
ncbi:MAG: thioredoxin-disulfide reductase [Deltaproteobacteria bacterium]|nr:thioredoxin-disulfide reductase [Deltaproteobacteria bacterium]